MIGCLDLDAFYVAVERKHDPSLCGRPVIVGGHPHGRGVVCSASYEARSFGIRSGMASSAAYRLCPNAVFLRPKFEAYEDCSRQVREILERYAPVVQQASVDEFFFSFDGCERLYRGDVFSAAGTVRKEIRDLGVTASIGMGGSKPLAKVASNLAKPDGQLLVFPGEEARFLSSFRMDVIPGIGPCMQKKMSNLGLHTVEDLQRIPVEYLRAAFGKTGESIHEKSMGRGSAVFSGPSVQKRISSEHTLREDTTDRNFLLDILFWLTEKVIFRMRKEGLSCRTVTVKLRYADFTTVTRSATLRRQADGYGALRAAVENLFPGLYSRRVRVRLLGVAVGSLQRGRQYSMMNHKEEKLGDLVDELRRKHGLKALSLGKMV